MTETTAIDVSRWAQARRIGLAVCFVIAVICLFGLAGWAATDASFRLAVWKARVTLDLETITSNDPQSDFLGIEEAMRRIEWDSLGKRAIAVCAVVGAELIAMAAACCLAVRRPTVRSIAGCVTLIAGWVGLYITLDMIQDWRAQRQISALLPKFEQAATALHAQWPTQSGEFPPGMPFYVSAEKYPDVILLRGRKSSHPFREDFGRTISRGDNSIIRFDLMAAYDSCVEYHPQGTSPAAYKSGLGYPSPPVASVIPLKEKWYLVRYRER